MHKKWAGCAIVLSLCISLLAPAGHSQAASGSVKVTLPTFPVSLNGHAVDNAYREYPLLVYRDITYIPMTWYDVRMLGLENTWSPKEGTSLKKGPVTSSYVALKSKQRNASNLTAKISSSAYSINGKKIDNAKEKYPILSFRDVPYIPLTWRFAHDEFGWDYKWNGTKGLSIASHNPQTQTVNLPDYAGKNDVALFKGYYYFVETKGMTNHIYRAPVNQPTAKKEIYSYTFYMEEYGPQIVTFQIRDDALWFTYHQGGGFTGSNAFVKISDDGKAKLMFDGYLDFRDTSYGTLFVNFGADNDSGTLYLSPTGQGKTNRKGVGNSDIMFAQHVSQNLISSTAVIGDDVYVLCSLPVNNPNLIYIINLKTNETEKIVNTAVTWFRILDNKLYYVKTADKMLYSSALDGTGETKQSEHAVTWFDGAGSSVFYTTKKTSTEFDLYRADPKGQDPLVSEKPVAEAQVLNGQLVCRYGAKEDYGVILFDASGNVQLKVTDATSHVFLSDDGILLKASKDTTVKLVH